MYFDLFLEGLGKMISPSCPIIGKYDNEKNGYVFPLLKGGFEFSIFVEPKENDSVLIQITYHQQTKLAYRLEDGSNEDVYNKWLSSPDYDAAIQGEMKDILYCIYATYSLCK